MGAEASHEKDRDPTAGGSPPHPYPAFKTSVARTRPKGPAVGIDLGTTYSSVAVCRKGTVDLIANGHGSRTTPSCVAFAHRERLVGEPAEAQAALDPENAVLCVKRLIGRRYDDPSVQLDLKSFPFRVVQSGCGGKVKVQVVDRGLEKSFYPEEILAMVISRLKRLAEAHLGRPVTQAVLTVPAYFGDAQRQATVDAGAIAGLTVLRLINEPAAAAVAYGLDGGLRRSEKRSVLVFDLGGGTLDVSVLTAHDGVFEVVASAGDPCLGGEDFDRRLAGHLAEEFTKRHKEDLGESRKAVQRLKSACEKAKRTLSGHVTAVVAVDSLFKGIDFQATVTRATFEDLCADLFRATLTHVERALDDAGLKKTEVDDVLAVGGSTRIPMIRRLLSRFFDGKALCQGVDPDEAVARGAAVQAAVLTGHRYQNLQNLLLLDVTPVSLGLETVGGVMDVLVKRNSPIPTKETRTFSTTEDNQSSLFLQIYEGERTLTKHNRLLRTLTLSGLRPAPRHAPVVAVTFHVDRNNILTVTATEKGTGYAERLTVTDTRGRLDREEMERIVREEEEHRRREAAEREKLEALNALESSALRLKRAAAQEASLDGRAKRRVLEMCEETAAWAEGNRRSAPKEELEERRRELEDLCSAVIRHFGAEGEEP